MFENDSVVKQTIKKNAELTVDVDSLMSDWIYTHLFLFGKRGFVKNVLQYQMIKITKPTGRNST